MSEQIDLIAHAPIQTRPSKADSYERYLALFTAEALRVIEEDKTGVIQPRIDVWNTYSQKVDSELNIEPLGAWTASIQQQIDKRYEDLRNVGINTDNRVPLLDSDPQYAEITLDMIKEGLRNGTFIIEDTTLEMCEDCGYYIALEGSGVCNCPKCNSSNIAHGNTPALILQFNEQDKLLMQKMHLFPYKGVCTLRVTNELKNTFLASKQRAHGVSLNVFGLDNFVLDPKIGLGMMGNVIQELGYGNLHTFVQGRDSLQYSLPFLALFSPTVEDMVLTSLVDPVNLSDLSKSVQYFYRTTLPLLAISSRVYIDAQQTLNWQNSANQAKLRMNRLNELVDPNNERLLEDNIHAIWECIFNYRIELAYTNFTSLLKRLCKESNTLSMQSVEQLNTLAKIFISYEN